MRASLVSAALVVLGASGHPFGFWRTLSRLSDAPPQIADASQLDDDYRSAVTDAVFVLYTTTWVEVQTTATEVSRDPLHELIRRQNVYTTTWTETQTYTSTYTSWPAASSPGSGGGGGGGVCVPDTGAGEKACGSVCCKSSQYCAWEDQCLDNGQSGTTTITRTDGTVITTQFSAPYRVTGSTASSTHTSTTTTSHNGTLPTGTGGGGGGLSGGAIAGIVLGTLAGVLLLLLLCIFLLCRGAWYGLLGLLGLGGSRRRRRSRDREEIIVEERFGRRPASRHRSWYGSDGRSTAAGTRRHQSRPRTEKRKKEGRSWLGMGALAASILLLLGLRRDRKRREREVRTRSRSRAKPPPPASSRRSSTYYSDSYSSDGRSRSSVTDDRRTRTTRTGPSRVSTTRVEERRYSRSRQPPSRRG